MTEIMVHPRIVLQKPLTIDPDRHAQAPIVGPENPSMQVLQVEVDMQVLQPVI